ncbi:MAG: type II secretion system protein [Clostridia bacterium]
MVERIKNKKGFTIIEVMVVIALIGILAAVLVPKFGGVKDTARGTGVLTNAKMVEAYVASIIDGYKNGEAIGATAGTGDMIEAIEGYFTANPLDNPYTGTTSPANVVVEDTTGTTYSGGAALAADAGVIYVVLNDITTTAYINGFDNAGNEMRNTQRTIER